VVTVYSALDEGLERNYPDLATIRAKALAGLLSDENYTILFDMHKKRTHKAKEPATTRRRKGSLEDRYLELFQFKRAVVEEEDWSLEQPSPSKIVPSVTTYGAYDEPVLGG